MPIPEFQHNGDLPVGIYRANLDEVVARFGGYEPQRRRVTSRLIRIWTVASNTGHLERFVIFGSYVTDKPSPGDVDVIMVMSDSFSPMSFDQETRTLFDHEAADRLFGGSVFWVRRSHIVLLTVDELIENWQTKRDQSRPWNRGGNTVIQNDIELAATQERIRFFQSILAQLRVTATAEEFPIVSSGYRIESEKMHAEVMEYLLTYAGKPELAGMAR